MAGKTRTAAASDRKLRHISAAMLVVAGVVCVLLLVPNAGRAPTSLLSRREMSRLLRGFENELKSERRTEAEGEVANDRKVTLLASIPQQSCEGGCSWRWRRTCRFVANC